MNAQSVRIVIWLTAVIAWCVPASAQSVTLEYDTPRNGDPGYQHYVFDGTYVTAEVDMGSGSGRWRVAVRDLDLSRVPEDEDMLDASTRRHSFSFWCKQDLSCIEYSNTGGPKGLQLFGSTPFSPNSSTIKYADVYCPNPSDCVSFARAIRASLVAGARPSDTGNAARAPVPGPARVSEPVVSPSPSVADELEKRLPEESAAQKQANALLEESKKLLKQQQCIAAMSTYRSGPQRDLPPDCLSDIDQMSVYRSSPGSPQPSGLGTEPVIDGSGIPSQIDFTKRAIDRAFVGPPSPPAPSPQPPSGGSADLNAAPNTPSTTLTPTYDSTTRSTSPATSDDGPTPKLEVLPTHPAEPSTLERWMDKLGIAAPKPGPMHQAGAPDDTLENHQADMDKATNGWNYISNPLKYPLEIQRVVNDKINRILIPIWPEDK